MIITYGIRSIARNGKRSLSARSRTPERYRTRRDGGQKWDMLRKQEYIYETMFTSGEVEVESHGAPDLTKALVEALRLQWAYGHPYTPKGFPLLTHAFHAYPAGMQPATARHLLETVLPGGPILDPFVGGGTVVLEAMRAGRLGVGADISPLALFVSRGRCWTAPDGELEGLREAARAIAETSSAELGTTPAHRVSGADWEVVKMAIADYLYAEGTANRDSLEHALWFVFSVARARAAKARHYRPIAANHYFQSVCMEYASAVSGLTREAALAAVPLRPPSPILIHRDARQPFRPSRPILHGESGERALAGGKREVDSYSLDTALSAVDSQVATLGERWNRREGVLCAQEGRMDNARHEESDIGKLVFDAVLTSPPYPGVYDYLGEARYARSQLGTLPRSTSPEKANKVVETGATCKIAQMSAIGEGAARSPSLTESVFVDSTVPSGRDWPSIWTDGEIGAKSDARRRRKTAALACADRTSEIDSTQSRWEAVGGIGDDNEGGLASKWSEDQRQWLMATADVLRPGGGKMAVMIGDGEGLDTRLCLLQEVEALGSSNRQGSLGVVGWATLRAAQDARRNMRTEHLILLEKS